MIDLGNITEFKRRLEDFCLYKSNKELNQSQPEELVDLYTEVYDELRVLLSIFTEFAGYIGKAANSKEPANAEIVNLTRSITEKEQIIEQLKCELPE